MSLNTESGVDAQVSLSQVLSALSHALDLTDGQPLGHTVRTCIIGMRIAEQIGLTGPERSALYYALLLKDAGCSNNASRMAALFGSDDRLVKPRMKIVDWHDFPRLTLATMKSVAMGRGLTSWVRHLATIVTTHDPTKELIALRCDRGASIARRLGFPEATATAIRSLDEHWSGHGYAEGLADEAIPLLSRICLIAQTVETVHSGHGVDAAMRLIRQRRGTWFDPALVDMVMTFRDDTAWWRHLRTEAVNDLVIQLEPSDQVITVGATRLDDVARAFAEIIDAKSPFTFNHSLKVAEGARRLATQLGMGADEQRRLFRAGLLHDIGKLGVSSLILDKDGPLDAAEWVQVERHPVYSLSILSRVGAFGEFAWTASIHHERLDGSGYPWKLKAEQIDEPARVLAVADCYDALTSDRPYRPGVGHDRALKILSADAGSKLARQAIEALASGQLPMEQYDTENIAFDAPHGRP